MGILLVKRTPPHSPGPPRARAVTPSPQTTHSTLVSLHYFSALERSSNATIIVVMLLSLELSLKE